MALTAEAKRLLAETIRGTAQSPERGLRHRLLEAIKSEAERRYRLSVPIKEAGLDEAHRRRRERLDAYLDERTRATKPKNTAEQKATRERLLFEAVKEAAATLVNRIVTLRLLEASGLSRPAIVTGGWSSKGYAEFRQVAPGLLDDETEGYAFLLGLVFDELATDLPGLFGDVGVSGLLPIPAKALSDVVEALDDRELASAWTDDVTLGWVYQFWNDPEREQLDATLDAQEKLQPWDVSCKTALYTERCMVDWLLQNTLGHIWLCICRKNGWTPEAERILSRLEARRSEWRVTPERGDTLRDECEPAAGELERQWRYYVRHTISDREVQDAPESIRSVKLLDPACGSGHFLVVACDLLVSFYREEARHRGQHVPDHEIAESILENNLHGIDIDRRSIQIAAAALWMKAKRLSPAARPRRINVVAPVLHIAALEDADPALEQLRCELSAEAGIPAHLTSALLAALSGVDDLGSLLNVDGVVEEAVRAAGLSDGNAQGHLFGGPVKPKSRVSADQAKAEVLDRLERFASRRARSEDLGLRIDGEELAAGLTFIELTDRGAYHVVVGNPPYFGTQSLADCTYIDSHYPRSKENLCTALLERACELTAPSGRVGFVTVRNWLYVSQLKDFRLHIFRTFPPVAAVDLGLGSFDALKGVEAVLLVTSRATGGDCFVCAPLGNTAEEKATSLMVAEYVAARPADLARLPGCPFVYRWTSQFIDEYLETPLLGDVAPVRVGMKTSDNLRFLRRPWEVSVWMARDAADLIDGTKWVPYVKGAQAKTWIEPLSDLVNWQDCGLEVRVALDAAYGQTPQAETYYFKLGVAFSTIGRSFVARAHRYPSIFDVAGSSVFPPSVAATVCLLNSESARHVVQDLNPTVNFQVGDVARIPYRVDPEAGEIFGRLDEAFLIHETTDELGPRFWRPGPSPWRQAQDWAQQAVNRRPGSPLPAYDPSEDDPSPQACFSYAFGVAIGRFAADGTGWVDGEPSSAVPDGIFFLSEATNDDSLRHAAATLLHEVSQAHPLEGADLRTYLRRSFFSQHKDLYEARPIYFPISSGKKSFVAFVSIHRWQKDTLALLLADYLAPEKRRLEGELEDVKRARAEGARRAVAERRFAELQRFLEELNDLIEKVTEVAERGPAPPDDSTPPREVDARHAMDLDDGVMVNSAALWALVEPQWKQPRTWWQQLAQRRGPKGTHFDWSRTARRYFPTRVENGCREDANLAAAHRRLWELHPATAYRFELRIQATVRTDFYITEPGADAHRQRFLEQQPETAKAIQSAQRSRRRRQRRGDRQAAPEGSDA